MSSPSSTHLARDVSAHIPSFESVPGLVRLTDEHDAIWQRAAPHLRVRNNDSHTLYAYGIARALAPLVDGANADIALPAILLHDTGWSTVPDAEVLEAIAPGGGRADLVRHHEIEGARIAREILGELGFAPERIDAVARIIDGHDSRLHALDATDAVVKDSDKIWRVTPHGITTVIGWFGLTNEESLRITAARVHDSLFTDQGRAMARALMAIGSIDLAPQRQGLV